MKAKREENIPVLSGRLVILFALMLFGSESKFTPPLIFLGQKKISLLSVDEVSHSHLNAGEVLNERIINA